MRKRTLLCLVWGLGALAWIQVCGCNLTPTFCGNKDDGAIPANMKPGKNGPNGPEKPFVPAGKNEYLAPPPTPLPEMAARVSQSMAKIEDDRKVMVARMQQMDIQLQEKEKAVILANYEIKEATKQVTQTREELKRWKEEMESLRKQLCNVEKENKGTLETIIRTLEQFMDHEKTPEAAGPILPKQ